MKEAILEARMRTRTFKFYGIFLVWGCIGKSVVGIVWCIGAGWVFYFRPIN